MRRVLAGNCVSQSALAMEHSYADPATPVDGLGYEWPHTVSDILGAVSAAGLRIEHFEEYPFCAYQRFPFMTRDGDGWWRLPKGDAIPMMFSLAATK